MDNSEADEEFDIVLDKGILDLDLETLTLLLLRLTRFPTAVGLGMRERR